MSGLLGKALGEQLVKAGIASETQLEKAKQKPQQQKSKGRRKNTKPKRSSQKGNTNREAIVDIKHTAVTRTVSKKNKVNELIRNNLVSEPGAEQNFNFAVNGKLRQINVTEAQAEKIANGELAIVKSEIARDPYVLVDAKTAIAIRDLQPNRLVAFYQDATEDTD